MSYFEDMYDPQLEDDEGSGPGTTTCKYCHTRGLYWVFKDMAWRLVSEAGKLHVCKAYKAYLTAAAGDEFSDLDAADNDTGKNMTPEEAKARYEAEWLALNADKEAATTPQAAKRCRQALSALSVRYAARFKLNKPEPEPEPEPEPDECGVHFCPCCGKRVSHEA